MNSPAWNTIAMAILGTLLVVLGTSTLSEIIFEAEEPEVPGYHIEVAEAETGEGGGQAAAAEQPIAVLLASADAGAGESVAKKCSACHVFEKGGANKAGPVLWNVVGRPIASVDGFGYSEALTAFSQGGKVWDYEQLNGFLTKPTGYVPGTKMTFAGLADAGDRANMIAYLRTQSDNPLPLPEVPAAVAEAAGAATAPGEQVSAETAMPEEGSASQTEDAVQSPGGGTVQTERPMPPAAQQQQATTGAAQAEVSQTPAGETGQHAEQPAGSIAGGNQASEPSPAGAAATAGQGTGGGAPAQPAEGGSQTSTATTTVTAAPAASSGAVGATVLPGGGGAQLVIVPSRQGGTAPVAAPARGPAQPAQPTQPATGAIPAPAAPASGVTDVSGQPATGATGEVQTPASEVQVAQAEQPAAAASPAAAPTGAAAAASPAVALVATADVAVGQRSAKKCAACHTFEEGGPNKVGPNLWNVVNRKVASVPGFAYSEAMKAYGAGGKAWDYAHLDIYLADPKGSVPGNKMAFAGIKKDAERGALLAYLRSLSAEPAPLQ